MKQDDCHTESMNKHAANYLALAVVAAAASNSNMTTQTAAAALVLATELGENGAVSNTASSNGIRSSSISSSSSSNANSGNSVASSKVLCVEDEKQMVGGCCVCADDSGYSDNQLVYCDGHECLVAVHQGCYGIITVPEGNWYCKVCEHKLAAKDDPHEKAHAIVILIKKKKYTNKV